MERESIREISWNHINGKEFEARDIRRADWIDPKDSRDACSITQYESFGRSPIRVKVPGSRLGFHGE